MRVSRLCTLVIFVAILSPSLASGKSGALSEDEIIARAEKDAEGEEDPFFIRAEKEGAKIARKKELAAQIVRKHRAVHESKASTPVIWHEAKAPVRQEHQNAGRDKAPDSHHAHSTYTLGGHGPKAMKNSPNEVRLETKESGSRMRTVLRPRESSKPLPIGRQPVSSRHRSDVPSREDEDTSPTFARHRDSSDPMHGPVADSFVPSREEYGPTPVHHEIDEHASSAYEKRDIGEDLLRNMMASLNKATASEVDAGGYKIGPGEEDQEDTVPPQRYMTEMLNEIPQEANPADVQATNPTLAEVVPSSQTHMLMMSNATADNTTASGGGVWQAIENMPAWSSMQTGLKTLQKELMGFSKVLNTEVDAVGNSTTPAATSSDTAPQLEEKSAAASPQFHSAEDIADDINNKLISLRAELDTFKKMRKARKAAKTAKHSRTDLAEKQTPSHQTLEDSSEY